MNNVNSNIVDKSKKKTMHGVAIKDFTLIFDKHHSNVIKRPLLHAIRFHIMFYYAITNVYYLLFNVYVTLVRNNIGFTPRSIFIFNRYC